MEQARLNQVDRILIVLMDGEWHTGLEFTQLQRPILSYTRRIFELRKKYDIEIERKNGHWAYRLKP